ncbi:MAG: BatA domain-containing protein [Leadbetterella sp.]
MQFLAPGVLWGLLAMSIPVIIHLFHFRRTKKVFFTNVSLLKTVDIQTSSFRKLLQYLLMACRMLVIACLILAFAQPMWNKNSTRKSPVGVNGIYIDNSLSMQNTTTAKSLLDMAVLKVEELLGRFVRANNMVLVSNDFDNKEQFVETATQIKDRLTSLKNSETPRSLSKIYQRLHSIATKNNPSAENHFFLFSDFQKSTLGNLDAIKIDPKDHLYLVPTHTENTKNLFVDSVWLNVPIVREMQVNSIHAEIANSGNKPAEAVSVKLYLDGVLVSSSSVEVAAGGKTKVLFPFTVKSRGDHSGYIVIEDQPVVFDNTYYFNLKASPSIQVLHLYGDKSSENYISRMYAKDSLFTYSSLSASAFDPERIQSCDLLVLEEVRSIEGDLKNQINTFLSKGGSVCVIPSENAQIGSLAEFLKPFGVSNFQKNSGIIKPENFIELAEPFKNSSFFEDVFERSSFNSIINLPRSYPLFTWQGVGEGLFRFKNNKLFMSRIKASRGTIYLMAAPLRSTYGNFGEHAYFVPSFYKIASLSTKPERIAYAFDEEEIRVFLPNAPKEIVYKLKLDKTEIIPNQRVVDNTLVLSLPKSSQLDNSSEIKSGVYDLLLEGKKIRSLAFNHNSQESQLDYYTEQELKKTFEGQSNVQVFNSVFDPNIMDAYEKTSSGTSLWKYFIVGALLFLLAEILLIRFWRKSPKPTITNES